jgi:RNA polymerase sigma factor (sigma-70 family)
VDHPLERFAGLYDQYYRNVLHYALQHAESGSAEDVASETFLIAWRRWPDIPEPPLPWLLGVARNLLRKQAAAGRRRQLLAERIAALSNRADLTSWDAAEHVIERAAALDALASLPEHDVETLTLVTWHGLTVRAAASVVGCTPTTFAVRLHRARRRLNAALRAADRMENPPAHRSVAGRPLTASGPRHASASRPPAASASKEQA